MKVMYVCFGRAHSSVVAASLHLNRLDPARVPSVQEIIHTEHFDKAGSNDIGVPLMVGCDEKGRAVYIIGLGGQRVLAKSAIESLRESLGLSPYDMILVDTLGEIGWLSKIGGFLSRRLNWVAVGRPLVAMGIKLSYPCLVRLVDGVKKELDRIEKEKSHLCDGWRP